jgi:hypothetical protein
LQNSTSSAGRELAYYDASSDYETTFGNTADDLVWEFNIQQSRSDPSGFGSSSYGSAFILGATSSDITNGNSDGYAVIIGNGGTPDPISIVRFEDGLNINSDITNTIISSNLTSYDENNYFSVRVVYTPFNQIHGSLFVTRRWFFNCFQ